MDDPRGIEGGGEIGMGARADRRFEQREQGIAVVEAQERAARQQPTLFT